MAKRRMFAKTIIDSDAFLDMPLSTQSLYFHLSMRADDDGFINNPKKIQRMIGASDDDMKVLISKRFLLPFESGIVVVKHWKIHNYIQKDRYQPTIYQAEMALLCEKKNKAYTERKQNVYISDTQVRVGKGSQELGEDSVVVAERETDTEENECDYCDPDNQLQNYFGGIFLTEKQAKDLLEKIPLETFDRYIERMKDYPNIKNHYQTMLKWYEEDTAVKKTPKYKNKFNNYTDTNEIDFKAQQEQALRDMLGE